MAYVGHKTELSVEVSTGDTEVKFSYTGQPYCEIFLTTPQDKDSLEADKRDIEQLILGLQAIVAVME